MHWIGLKTLILRECGVIIRFWGVTLAPPVITTVLYFTIFGGVIGKRIGSVEGVDYAQYLAPGLVVLWVVPYAFSHTAGGFLGARLFRYLEELIVTPLPGWVIVLGYVLGGAIRGLTVGLIAVLIAMLYTHFEIHSVLAGGAVICLTALISSLGGFMTGLLASSFDQVPAIQSLVVTPLMYVGGIFYSVSTLPSWARNLSLLNPMFYPVNALRYSVLGVSDVNFGTALLIMCASGLVLVLATVMLMARGVGLRD